MNYNNFREFCKQAMEAQPPIRQWHRERIDDDQVADFIRNERAQAGTRVSASSVLRRIRDSGFACEQSRLRKLFQKVSGL